MLLVGRQRFADVVNLLVGYDCANGFLAGSQELVELKYGSTRSVHWSALISSLVESDTGVDAASDRDQLERLLDLLDEFLAVDPGRACLASSEPTDFVQHESRPMC